MNGEIKKVTHQELQDVLTKSTNAVVIKFYTTKFEYNNDQITNRLKKDILQLSLSELTNSEMLDLIIKDNLLLATQKKEAIRSVVMRRDLQGNLETNASGYILMDDVVGNKVISVDIRNIISIQLDGVLYER